MRIALCTTCKGRLQHLTQTLPRNLHDNRDYADAVFVLLLYGDKDAGTERLIQDLKPWIDNGRLAVYCFDYDGPFAMAHSKNMAHRCGLLEGADVLVNVDADNWTGIGFAAYVAKQFEDAARDGRHIMLRTDMIKEGPDRMAKGCNGRIGVSAGAFLKAGGYDEKYDTWSPDDKDFNFRLKRLGYCEVNIERQYLDAILHNNKMRFREYPHVKPDDDYEFKAVANCDQSIANWGKVGCGTVTKNFDATPIELKPLPTRIFGIGLHKTATTSLHRALQILGYESAHWKNAHWAKAIWNQMRTLGKSATLERSFALVDLPIPLLYRELDAAYPGSKFILTVRPERDWIKSVRNHWDPAHNRFRGAWKTDPFTNIVHRELYGQCGFDAELFLARYRRHNAEVQEWFRWSKHPEDLLVMRMSEEYRHEEPYWVDLCRFLNVPVPNVPYPTEMVTQERGGL